MLYVAITAITVTAPSFTGSAVKGRRLSCVQPKWNNDCVEDRGDCFEWVRMKVLGGVLLTILHPLVLFFKKKIKKIIICQSPPLNTPQQQWNIRHIATFMRNECCQLCFRQNMYCSLVVNILGKTLWMSSKVIEFDWFCQVGESPAAHALHHPLSH